MDDFSDTTTQRLLTSFATKGRMRTTTFTFEGAGSVISSSATLGRTTQQHLLQCYVKSDDRPHSGATNSKTQHDRFGAILQPLADGMR